MEEIREVKYKKTELYFSKNKKSSTNTADWWNFGVFLCRDKEYFTYFLKQILFLY